MKNIGDGFGSDSGVARRGEGGGISAGGRTTVTVTPQHRLYFLPLPHGTAAEADRTR